MIQHIYFTLLKNLERGARYGSFIGKSPARLTKFWLYDFILGISNILYWICFHFRHLRKINLQKNLKRNKHLIIIANGPSAKKLSVELIRNLSNENNLEIMAMNDYYVSSISKIIVPHIYILSDSYDFIADSKNVPLSGAWSYIKEKNVNYIAIPSGIAPLGGVESKIFHFCDKRAPRSLKMISPSLPHSFGRFTALRAISLALQLGYEKIYLLGFDNTHFLNFILGEDNTVLWRSGTHFYESDPTYIPDYSTEYKELPEDIFTHGIRSIFETLAILLDDYHMLKNDRIINLDKNSWTDSFVKLH